MDQLEKYRSQIDQIDEQLVKLLNDRARVVVEVGKYKQREKNAPPIYAPDRERAVFDKVKAHNTGPLPDRCLLAIWRELMSGSFFLERPLRIAFLGPEGSFSHAAAALKFGQSVEYEPLADIRSVFDEITREHCDLGLVPVENAIAGGIIETLDALMDSSVIVCGEMLMAVHHNLLANCPLEEVEHIYSKPEVFAQCRLVAHRHHAQHPDHPRRVHRPCRPESLPRNPTPPPSAPTSLPNVTASASSVKTSKTAPTTSPASSSSAANPPAPPATTKPL